MVGETLDDFELHLRLCPDCLSDGDSLCPEAQGIADGLRAARARPRFTARRRPIFPTVRLPGILV